MRPASAAEIETLNENLNLSAEIQAATDMNRDLMLFRRDILNCEFDPAQSALTAIQLGEARENALALAEDIAWLLEQNARPADVAVQTGGFLADHYVDGAAVGPLTGDALDDEDDDGDQQSELDSRTTPDLRAVTSGIWRGFWARLMGRYHAPICVAAVLLAMLAGCTIVLPGASFQPVGPGPEEPRHASPCLDSHEAVAQTT